jgi:hypothetical protein
MKTETCFTELFKIEDKKLFPPYDNLRYTCDGINYKFPGVLRCILLVFLCPCLRTVIYIFILKHIK